MKYAFPQIHRDAEEMRYARAGLKPAEFSCSRNDSPNATLHARKFRKILVPLTLSADSHAGLTVARNLARNSGAELVLLHVVQLNIAGEERGIHRTRLLDDLCREADLRLRELANAIGESTAIEVAVGEGRPAETIVEAARRLEVDAIVLSTKGHRGYLRWLHRNTALRVGQQAPCAVWLVSLEKWNAPADLRIVNRANSNGSPNRLADHENPDSLRSILRVLFS